MLCKIDKRGFVINEASEKKIQPEYPKILEEINKIYFDKIGDNLLSIYIRGSVSIGKATPFFSDIDSVAITKDKLSKKKLFWAIKASKYLEKKYRPRIIGVELVVVSLKELLKSKDYSGLRVNLKTQSVCLYGKDILPLLQKVKPGKKLALQIYDNLFAELTILKKIFSGKIINREYLFRKRPIKFWCVWAMRVILRASLGLVMVKKPVYSQDSRTCFKVFSEEYPQYKKQMEKALKWAVEPTNNKKQLLNFLNGFGSEFLRLWSKSLKV